ncbi:MAG: hypothetical protein Q4D38_05265 [Planctomycetia bacterium]|nr:hypothetical protein [Planctomycetia bacterium]
MQKRTLLMLLFVLFGFLPVLALLAWGEYRRTAWYALDKAAAFATFIEMPVVFEGVEHLRPHKTAYRGTQIFLPNTTSVSTPEKVGERPLAEIPETIARNTTIERNGETIRQMNWAVGEIQLAPECLEPLWLMHQRILNRVQFWKQNELYLVVEGSVRVGEGGTALDIQKAQMRIFDGAFGPETNISFEIPDGDVRAKINLTLVREQKQHSSVLIAEIDVSSDGISTERLASLFPIIRSVGQHSRYHGKISVQQSFSGWSCIFNGKFSNIDLAQVFGSNAPLSGVGELELKNTRFDGGRLIWGEGSFRAHNGTIRRAFLSSFAQATQLSTQGIPLPMGDPLSFVEMGFDFRLRMPEMQISGACSGHGAGVFVTNSLGPILREPTHSRPPFSAIVLFDALGRFVKE